MFLTMKDTAQHAKAPTCRLQDLALDPSAIFLFQKYWQLLMQIYRFIEKVVYKGSSHRSGVKRREPRSQG